jgi:polyisoprenoid-binding protein YceI
MKKSVLFIVSVLFINAVILAQTATLTKIYCDKKLSSISYSMSHPLHSWTAVSKDITSVIVTDDAKKNISQVAVSVKVSTFDSKNANRDSHMMETVEAIKYPSITFTSSSIKQEGNKLTVTGNLNFHGVNQVISFVANFNNQNNKIEVIGGFSVKITQFNIKPPSLMGMETKDEIKLDFRVVYQ